MMPPIEMNPLRPVSGIEPRIHTADAKPATAPSAPVAVNAASASAVLDAGAAPVDVERVSEIRKAVENGTYPLTPARVADAMIAAGFLLRSGE